MAETAAQRLDRITQEVLSGQRTLDSVRRSVNLQAGLAVDYGISAQATANDASLTDPAAVRSRVEAIFRNRNVVIGAGDPSGAPAPAVPDTDDAFAYIQGVLDSYGLGSLYDWALEQLQAGRSSDRILLDLRDRPEFQARFPAIAARQQAGLAPLSPAEYVAYEQQARQVMRQFGLPSGFYDSNDDFTRLLTEDVSVAELYERVQQGYQQVAFAEPEVRSAFADFFGPQGDSALASFFLDPDRAMPALRNMVTEAQIGGAARQFDLDVGASAAQRLREFGITQAEAQAGFRQVRALDPLFTETVSESADFTAEAEGIGGVLGVDPNATRALERRRQSRLSAFQGGGGAAVGQRGVAGLGADEAVI